MTIATFSVPVDIPWKRIAFSPDMMDRDACDRNFPLRWRSSVAIFEYEPPEDQQRIDGFRVSYLKVACSITGYQPDGKEIRIRERLNRAGWGQKKYTDVEVNLNDAVSNYYACYGAILEVVVTPRDQSQWSQEDYPYFADFDPKKRELYELVTNTGEIMSRSLDDVNVRLGQTTLQSHEVYDKTTVSGEITGSIGVASAKGSAAYESGTKDLSQRSTENIRTTDAARENRETFSHTTQLSQMYHQLNSYHLGTNRAAFFILPRPHVIQSTNPDGTPRTFVDGPRELEGMQEFMLVVVRPKNQERICVEAYLETAHLMREPIYEEGNIATLHLKGISSVEGDAGNFERRVGENVENTTLFFSKPGSATYPELGSAPVAIDMERGQGLDASTGKKGGYDIVNNSVGPNEVNVDVASDHVTVRGKALGQQVFRWPRISFYPATLDVTLTIYLKSTNVVGYKDVLFLTGRSVCSCLQPDISHLKYDKDVSVVFEKRLSRAGIRQYGLLKGMSIQEANQLGATIHRELIQSLSSADRYPRGTVSLLDTQFVAGTMAAQLHDADRSFNKRLADWEGVEEGIRNRILAYSPAITRAQLLEMPLTRQVEKFGLAFDEAVNLRRSLIDLDEPQGPPPIPERQQVDVPFLHGLKFKEAQEALAAAGLALGPLTVVDSPMPSGSVVAQEPAAGVAVELEAEIAIQIASGLTVRLPEILGLPLSEAICRLRDAGLQSEPTVEGQLGPESQVVELEPSVGTWVTPNTPVTIRLERRSTDRQTDAG